jgi:acyl-CoA hydrolase
MRWPPRFRSLLAQFTLRVIVPLSLVMFGVIAASLYAYQQVVTTLLIDRDHQLAVLSAARVSEAVEGYARVLEALATSPEVQSNSAERRHRVGRRGEALQFSMPGW